MKKPSRQAKAVSKGKPSPREKPKAKVTKVTRKTVPRLGTDKPGKANDVSWHDRFLISLRAGSHVEVACKVAGVSRNTAYEHREKFSKFEVEWEKARRTGRKMRVESITDKFMDRIENGVLAFTGSGDPINDPKTKKQCREYQDTVVLKALSALAPDIFSEKHKVEFSGKLTMTAEEELEASRETKKSLLLTLAGGLSGNKAS